MPEVKVPELAESITEGTIAEWLKNVEIALKRRSYPRIRDR